MSLRSALPLATLVLATSAVLVAPSTAHATSSAELYRPDAYRYGRFEARIRYAAGNGVISSFFLWKDGSEMTGAFWNELDFEKLGADCKVQTNLIYGAPQKNHEQLHSPAFDLCNQYHDYRFEWTPDYISFAIDGQEIRRATGADAQAFTDNASAGMNFHFNLWPGNANFGGVFDAKILPVHQFISWAQYSAYANGTFQVSWREEFDGSTVPAGWAVGDWASPLNLSTHSAANVTFAHGAAVLSLTADDATGYTGDVPADPGAGGAPSAGAGGMGNAMAGMGNAMAGTSNTTGGTSAAQGGSGPSAGSNNATSGSANSAGGMLSGTAGSMNASSGSPSATAGSNGSGTSSGSSCSFRGNAGSTTGAAFGAALGLALVTLRRRKRH